jgi:hypothetical protein
MLMPDLLSWCQWLENTPMSATLRDSLWLFPAIETVHLFGIVALVGSTAILDLRLIGFTLATTPVPELARRVLPWAWLGFGIQVATGFFLFASEASRVYLNPAFRFKMLMLAAAGLNALLFHVTTIRRAPHWEGRSTTPVAAKIAGLSSLVLWFAIVVAGRMIAYFE